MGSANLLLNNIDRAGADIYPVVINLPIGKKLVFFRVINLVTMETAVWRDEDLYASFDIISLAECNNIPLVDDELKE